MDKLGARSWQRNYRAWFAGDTLAAAGGSIGSFAFPLVALAVTGSAQTAGLIGLVQGVGSLLGLMPGGLIADRANRRTVRIIGGCVGVILQGALGFTILTDSASAITLGALAFADRLRSGLCGPASEAILKDIVPRVELPGKFARNSGRDSVIDVAGSPAGGLLLAFNAAVPSFCSAAGHGLLAISSLFIGSPPRDPLVRNRVSVRELSSELYVAAKWMVSQSVRVHIIALATLLNFVTSGVLVSLTLFFGKSGMPYAQIGLLTTGLSACIFAGALVAPVLLRRISGHKIVFGAFVVVSFTASGIAFFPLYGVVFVLFCVLGFVVAPLLAATSGFLAQTTPSEMLGRVGAITTLCSSFLLPLAPALAGVGVEQFGPSVTLGLFATVSFLGVISIILVRSGVRTIPVVAVGD